MGFDTVPSRSCRKADHCHQGEKTVVKNSKIKKPRKGNKKKTVVKRTKDRQSRVAKRRVRVRKAPNLIAGDSTARAATIRNLQEEPTVQVRWAVAKEKKPVDPQVALQMKISMHSEVSAPLGFSEFRKVARPAFLPQTTDGDAGPLDSKFSGSPYLFAGEIWPNCPRCNKPMQLLVQLNLETLSCGTALPEGKGLLQVFYCTNNDPLCEMDTEANLPGKGKSKLVRVIQPFGEGSRLKVPKFPGVVGALQVRRIAGMKSIRDYPCAEETGRDLDSKLKSAGVEPAKYRVAMPFEGDKLGGWPRWKGSVSYPACPICKQKMSRLVLQLASGGLASWQWGDRGLAYLLQCPNHPDQVDLIWQ
jgi:hypothetical protein